MDDLGHGGQGVFSAGFDMGVKGRVAYCVGRGSPMDATPGECYAMGVKDQVACLAGVLGTWFPDRFPEQVVEDCPDHG